MPVLWRGQTPVTIRLNGVSVRRITFEGKLVYDGTRSVLVEVPVSALGLAAPSMAASAGAVLSVPASQIGIIGPGIEASIGAEASLAAALLAMRAPAVAVSAGSVLPIPASVIGVAAPNFTGGVDVPIPASVIGLAAPALTPSTGAVLAVDASRIGLAAPNPTFSGGVVVELPASRIGVAAPDASFPTFAPSGMTKVGTAQGSSTMTQLTGWAADPAYAGSMVSNNALVVNGSKPSATVSARVQWSPGAGGGTTIAVQIKKNGVLLATGTYVTTSPSTVSWTGPVANGDLITAEIRDSGTWANNYRGSIAAGTGTYVRVE